MQPLGKISPRSAAPLARPAAILYPPTRRGRRAARRRPCRREARHAGRPMSPQRGPRGGASIQSFGVARARAPREPARRPSRAATDTPQPRQRVGRLRASGGRPRPPTWDRLSATCRQMARVGGGRGANPSAHPPPMEGGGPGATPRSAQPTATHVLRGHRAEPATACAVGPTPPTRRELKQGHSALMKSRVRFQGICNKAEPYCCSTPLRSERDRK